MADAVSKALADVRASLDLYGDRVRHAARRRARRAAAELKDRLERAYPAGATASGKRRRRGREISAAKALKNSVVMGQIDDDGWYVVTTAPHAHLYEYGTGERQTTVGAARGASPRKGPLFIPAADEERRAMISDVQQLLDVEELPR